MSIVRRLSTRNLLAVLAGTVAVIGGGTAIAIAATSSTSVPAQEPLPVAVHQALAAPAVAGVTARIKFTDSLIDASSLPGGSPLLTGASGRLWASADGRARLELQSDAGGDVQILVDGRAVSLYDASAKTVYRATLPKEPGDDAPAPRHAVPTVAAIERAVAHLGADANLTGAVPTNVAGREAYSVKLSPKRDGGLVGAAELAWDAATGTPLRVGLYAAGKSDPVLELTATGIDYGTVDASVFAVQPPAGTKVVDLTPQLQAAAAGRSRGHDPHGARSSATTPAEVQAQAGFAVSAPAELAGLPRKGLRLVKVDGKNAVVSVYGKGLGGIAVFESPAEPATPGAPGGGLPKGLPSVSIGGATGTELATALGTLLTFDKAGVTYTVLGSVPPAAAEAAARGL